MFNINPTPFDVRLVAFRVPIRVHPSFWIVMALLGWNPERPQLTFIFVACAFFSVLVHELGHALTSEWFGWPTLIVLHFFGGVAVSDRYRNNTPGRSILVSLMGPGAGFLFWATIRLVEAVFNHQHILEYEYRAYVFAYLRMMNWYWSVFNLIPVLPLDGGHVCHSLCELLRLRNPLGVALVIGVAVSGAAAYYFLHYRDEQMAGMIMIMLCFQSVMGLQSRR
ncbi:site-2 protease family protein [Schlesneria paludicola]|uniref:site-2 protease family protein n=1 Tax=Schlesneria paludicola TaxID=360056 RepID=UPI00029AE92C|nr:site-2 protease family protein [Schlesneria paludicola]